MIFRTWFSGVACLILLLQSVLAGDLFGDPFIGREIAGNCCGDCNDITPNGMGVYEGVPAFQTLANDPAFTEMALRAILQTPHGDMPNVMPTREQTDHMIAYILSLKAR